MATFEDLNRKIYFPSELFEYDRDPWLQQSNCAMLGLFKAQEAMRRAESYRNFRVGVSILGLWGWDAQPTVVACGANRKMGHDDTYDAHAEEIALESFKAMGGTVISVMCLVGDIQSDQTSGLVTPTLLPCERRCTPMLAESGAFEPLTLIFSATEDLRTIQYYDLSTLQKAHETQDSSLLTTVELRKSDLDDQDTWGAEVVVPVFNRRYENAA